MPSHHTTEPQTRFEFDAGVQTKFAEYHAENPQVYATLRHFAIRAKQKGHARLSINMLFERVRWETAIEGRDDTFKMNNNYRAYYARLLMEQEPELRDFFETRRSRADAEL